jgi:hypothetical protein
VCSPGQTAGDMKVTTLTTRRKATESSTGQTAESTRVGGRMESNMELALTQALLVRQSKVNGPMERDFNGSHSDTL